MRKNLADISYASRVIVNFVLNFVGMATGVGWGKCDWQHSMAHLQKPPYRRKSLADISYTSQVIAHFCLKFRCRGNQEGSGVKLNNTIKLAILENHTIKPKITTLSHSQSYDRLKNCLIFPIAPL